VTEILGAFATEDDSPTVEPAIDCEKIAGKDPNELGARTTFSESIIAAVTASFPGRLLLGRLKVPSENVRIVLAAMSAPNVNSSSVVLTSWFENKLPATFVGDNTVVIGGDERVVARESCPTRVITSFAPEFKEMTGCKLIVIVTLVSDAMYLDNVICDKIHQKKKIVLHES
jgi:hypothetical protein